MTEETEVEQVADTAQQVEAPAQPDMSRQLASLKGRLDHIQAEKAAERQKREELEAKLAAYEGIDPEQAPKMREVWEKSQTEGERSESLRKQVEANAKRDRDAFEAEKNQWKTTKDKEYSHLSQAALKDRVISAVEGKKLRLRSGARESLLLHADRTFKVNDTFDDLMPREPSLDDKNNELTVDTWVDRLVSTHPYLFEGGEGGGARPGGRVGAKKQYRRRELSPEEKIRAVEEVRRGDAEWVQ